MKELRKIWQREPNITKYKVGTPVPPNRKANDIASKAMTKPASKRKWI